MRLLIAFAVLFAYGIGAGMCHELLKRLGVGNGTYNDGFPRICFSGFWPFVAPVGFGIYAFRAIDIRLKERRELNRITPGDWWKGDEDE